MRIVIDMQGAQTESRSRKIGRYILSLAKAMVRNRGDHEIILALNGFFSDTVDTIRDEFDSLLPQEKIRVWYAPCPVQGCDPKNQWRREAAQLIREAFLASLHPDIVHVTSLFEGFTDNAVTSIGTFASNLPTAVTVYDLIPLLSPEKYLANADFSLYYHKKIEFLNNAELILAISKSSARESRDFLNIPAKSVVNISAACDAIFQQRQIAEKKKKDLFNNLNINYKYILYTGGADPRKNLNNLIEAYAGMPDQLREKHQLVLSGKMLNGIVAQLKKTAHLNNIPEGRIIFTGYVSDENLVTLYNLCEVFIFPSLHEGFGLPALEAMSCGAAVIASKSTSLPEVIGRKDALFDPSDVCSIRVKLQRVLEDKSFKESLRGYGLQRAKNFSWEASAQQAISAFEKWYASNSVSSSPQVQPVTSDILIKALAGQHCFDIEPKDDDLRASAWCIAQNQPEREGKPQLFVDISTFSQRDSKTGVQRVVRSILRELLLNPPTGYSVEPVYADICCKGYRYAKSFSREFMGRDEDGQGDDPIEFQHGDIFLGLDLLLCTIERQFDYLKMLHQSGVRIFFVVYDLLPLTSGYFAEYIERCYAQWIKMIMVFDGAICISHAVADELKAWRYNNISPRIRPFRIEWFHLGADIENSMPSKGLPSNAEDVLTIFQSKPSFLMVGTIEPRKGHRQVLTAFEQIWNTRTDVNLVIVGVGGWMVNKLIELIRNHAERNNRLFWLKGISDEYLEKVYSSCTCLIAASEGEGFGLPLIEAAQHELPIIARDIPVFREVAGDHAVYFSGLEAHNLKKNIELWLNLYSENRIPESSKMPWLSWKQSTKKLTEILNLNT